MADLRVAATKWAEAQELLKEAREQVADPGVSIPGDLYPLDVAAEHVEQARQALTEYCTKTGIDLSGIDA